MVLTSFVASPQKHRDEMKLVSLVGVIGGLAVGLSLNTVVTDQYTKWMETKMDVLENKMDSVLLIMTDLTEDQMGLKADFRDFRAELNQISKKLDAAIIILEAMSN